MQTTPKIYVAGHRGMVGSAIVRNLQAAGYKHLLTRTHAELDLTDEQLDTPVAAAGIVITAVMEARRSGRGCFLDFSQREVASFTLGEEIVAASADPAWRAMLLGMLCAVMGGSGILPVHLQALVQAAFPPRRAGAGAGDDRVRRAQFQALVHGIGERMGLKDLPATRSEFDAFVHTYRQRHFVPDAASANVARATLKIMDAKTFAPLKAAA